MSESKQNPQNPIATPSLDDVKALIYQEKAGFALAFLGMFLVFLSAAVEPGTKNLFSIGGGIAFLVGLFLVIYRERSNSQFEFRTLQQKDIESKIKMQSLEETLEQVRSDLKTLQESSQKHAKEMEESKSENKNKENRISELERSLDNQGTEIQQKTTELQELFQQIQILTEQSQPDKIAEQFSARLYDLIVNLYDPKYGRSEPVTVVDVIEELYKNDVLQEKHFQDVLLKMNMFDPRSDD